MTKLKIVSNIEMVHSAIGSFFGLSLSYITNIMNNMVIIIFTMFAIVNIFHPPLFGKKFK